MQTRQILNSFPCPKRRLPGISVEKRALQASGEVRGKGKNKQKQQQQKRGETAKIRLQSESRDGLAGTRRLCFFLRP